MHLSALHDGVFTRCNVSGSTFPPHTGAFPLATSSPETTAIAHCKLKTRYVTNVTQPSDVRRRRQQIVLRITREHDHSPQFLPQP